MQRRYEYRRKLPHYQPDFKALFITFCTHNRWQLPESARSIVLEACLQPNAKRFTLLAAVVMPDHVHLILVPLRDEDGTFSIPEIMQGIKSTSAHQINKLLGRKGQVWQQESFDHVLRREESIRAKVDYLLANPFRRGLVTNPLDYKWLWRQTEVERIAV